MSVQELPWWARMFDLTGRVAVVTGGSRGIGRALVLAFAAAGADVVVSSRKLDACQEVAREVERTTGRRALAVAAHVGRWDDCDRLVDTTYAEFGRCDVLVNNAGMSPLYPELTSISEEYWDKVSAVNLKGPFRLGVRVGARMAASDGGSIINVSTIGSLRPGADELVYACAKAGLNALTIGLAEAFGPRVRANAILPGGVATDIAEAWTDEQRERAAALTTMGRIGVPDDLVGAALWLAGDASAWVSGILVRVDGGTYRQTS
ncbi:short-chain dehydrogenase [Frankia sp. CcI49]|uniref:SDR family NAD(P)-dependent oxidoreductase n=1 Tax=Frankia sp. CcI49 TaxID=1745382 RepID=UPI000977473D|nr:SDR family oxidoreductase [Frankia sp. CcI49]ONH55513.1 short-chain dehydrogenase [Frankia sp. CcI49]